MGSQRDNCFIASFYNHSLSLISIFTFSKSPQDNIRMRLSNNDNIPVVIPALIIMFECLCIGNVIIICCL